MTITMTLLVHYFRTAWRTLTRAPLYTTLTVLGMAVGLSIAILSGLIVRGEYTYDHFLQRYDNTYLCVSVLLPSGQPPVYNSLSNSALAQMLRLRSPEIQQVTRLREDQVELRSGSTHLQESIYWADPNALQVLELPMVSGDRSRALSQPDSVVLTSADARRIFGRTDVIGRYLQLGEAHDLRVTAVLQDFPAHHTHLASGILISGVSAYSKLAALDARAAATSRQGFTVNVLTYFNLRPGTSLQSVQSTLPSLMQVLWAHRPPGLGASVEPIRVDRLHLFPGLNPGVQDRVKLVSLTGTLVLLVACINFINLALAQSGRRAREVGIRKVTGAGWGTLFLQFIGESVLLLFLAAAIAVALVELSLPSVNAYLDTVADFNYSQNPLLLGAVASAALLLAGIAGIYPAVILASMRPVNALRGLLTQSPATRVSRQLLIAVQFAVLSALVIAAGVLYQQRVFATRDALQAETGQMLVIRSPCRAALVIELRRLPGVRGAACSGQSLLDGQGFENRKLKNGSSLAFDIVGIETGLLDLYGMQPLAGSFDIAGSTVGSLGDEAPSAPPAAVPRLVINQLALRALGYTRAAQAIGEPLQTPKLGPGPAPMGRIIGVAPDFSLNLLAARLKPTIYVAAPALDSLISVRLDPSQQPDTLTRLPRLWTETGGSGPVDWFFVRRYFQDLYANVQREDVLFGIFSGITLLLAVLGLFALASAIIERRTVEIGVRKAMGASDAQVFRLLLWQFSQPVLYGSILAWPAIGWLMLHWLRGYAYHVDLQLWLFPLATALALSMTWIAVGTHALRLAQAPPVTALRYE